VSDPLRVAVVGSGPAGFYAAGALLAAGAAVDMIERLPTPWGLVRLGVAPDHPKIKSVSRAFEKIALQDGYRFLGNVEVGRDIQHNELLELYDAVVYAVGAQTDRRMGIPGEDLPGSWPATEFVAWYKATPTTSTCSSTCRESVRSSSATATSRSTSPACSRSRRRSSTRPTRPTPPSTRSRRAASRRS
jgi:NADPH-dependent glutamate synthase beta subunit-like oxidoreductase